MKSMPKRARAIVIVVVLGCVALSTYAVLQGLPSTDARFAVLLAMAMISARMKVKLPGFDSNMSMNLPFILTGVVALSMPHAIVVGIMSTFVQCLPSPGKEMKLIQAAFNVCTMSNAIGLSFLLAHTTLRGSFLPEKPAVITIGALAFFMADTLPVAAIISATDGGRMWKIWTEMSVLTFPYFVLSAGLATLIVSTSHYVGLAWSASLPVMFLVFLSFRRYFRHTDAPVEAREALRFSAAAGD